jgi:peptidoglycan/xylan/chitin deacetylase (PgdA/CDA1 family)
MKLQNIPILLYHQISQVHPEQDPYGLAVTPAAFEAQMAYLHHQHYQCMRLVDVVKAMIAGETLPENAFAITFDDGYEDNYQQAFAIMQRHGFTATIFLVANQVGAATNWQGQDGAQSFPLLTWDQIREMHQQGIDFGSHTATHPHLDSIAPDKAEWELSHSKKVIEGALGVPVEVLAYPYERFNREMLSIAEKCGYLAAFGTAHLPESRYNLWRTELGSHDTLRSFAFKLSRWYRPYMRFKRAILPVYSRSKRLIRRIRG